VLDEEARTGFRAGNPDAIRAVYRTYGKLVFAVAHRVLRDKSLAEEATQETFLRAWRATETFDPGRELGPWLATIARRVAIDIFRREARRPHSALDEVSATDPAVVTIPETAERVYEAWEVRQAVDDLPADEQAVVRLQHLEGLTHAEIADRLNVPIGTVKSRSHRAHQRLARRLGHLRESA